MRINNSRNIMGLSLLAALVFLSLLPACRQEPEPLDRNRAPETFLTVAPPETTDAEYRVHLYWHGEDKDGIVTHYMWHRSDTLRTLRPDLEPELDFLDWNPEARKDDYLIGNFTYATDTVIVFKGFNDAIFARVNRQAFHIVAIDDGGRMDETPARIQFNARVKCVPEVEFWFESESIPIKDYEPGQVDTISMFEPFCISFIGETCNNFINGYQWLYGQKTYPDLNDDGVPDWYIPATDPPETIRVCHENRDAASLPSGDFYFRVRARDEAGAISESDIATGEGVFQVVINHDPDTKILFGENFYTDQDGVFHEDYIDFFDGITDSLPYHSRLRMHYMGWDDPRDSLEYNNPPVPIRFQFKFKRWGYALNGGISSYDPPWVPEAKAEDTNCNSDEDSTTMRIGTYDYEFYAKSFDEQYRYDHNPDTVSFVGNFPPVIEQVSISYDSLPNLTADNPFDGAVKIKGDTVYIAVSRPRAPREETDYVSPYYVIPDINAGVMNMFFRVWITAGGHDDRRDPPGAGIYGWWYSLVAQEDYYYRGEKEWLYPVTPDTLMQEVGFRLTVPFDFSTGKVDSSFVETQPLWMGHQDLTLRAADMKLTEKFPEGLRAVSPTFVDDDPCNTKLTDGNWVINYRGAANYARSDKFVGWFYFKLVY